MEKLENTKFDLLFNLAKMMMAVAKGTQLCASRAGQSQIPFQQLPAGSKDTTVRQT